MPTKGGDSRCLSHEKDRGLTLLLSDSVQLLVLIIVLIFSLGGALFEEGVQYFIGFKSCRSLS